MLRFLSKRKRSKKILLWGFVIILAAGLIVAFTPNLTGTSGPADDTVVARVGSDEITWKEFRERLAATAQQVGPGTGVSEGLAATYAGYGQQVLNELIQQKLIGQEADELRLIATDLEVRERLRQQFSPWPGYDQYRARLQQVGYSPTQFEEMLRDSITTEKLRSYVTAGVRVSPQDVEEEYRRNKTLYNIRWVDVALEPIAARLPVDEPGLRAFFEANRGEFRINTEQRKARYLFVDQAKASEAVQVSDEELRQAFVPERGIQEVRVSQIVLNLPKTQRSETGVPPAEDSEGQPGTATASAEQVSNRAEEILRRARGSEGKPAEDFAALAREFSQDPKTRTNGGDLGWINRKDKRKSDDPLNRVFGMAVGEISQAIIEGDKLYLLKVTEAKIPTFEESRDQLLKEARVQKGYTRAVEISGDAEERLKQIRDLEPVAAELNTQHGVEIATVRETRFFTQGETLSGLGSGTEFTSAVFAVQNVGDVTQRLSVDNGFAVAQYSERRDPRDPELDEVRSRVEERYKLEKALERARELTRTGTPEGLKAAADRLGLRTEERSGLRVSESVGALTGERDRAPIYELSPGQVVREPIRAGSSDTYVVAALVGRQDPDMGKPFEDEKGSLEERLLDERRNQVFTSFLSLAQKRLRESGKIRIYDDVINSALGGLEGPLPASGGRPTTPARLPRSTPAQ